VGVPPGWDHGLQTRGGRRGCSAGLGAAVESGATIHAEATSRLTGQ